MARVRAAWAWSGSISACVLGVVGAEQSMALIPQAAAAGKRHRALFNTKAHRREDARVSQIGRSFVRYTALAAIMR